MKLQKSHLVLVVLVLFGWQSLGSRVVTSFTEAEARAADVAGTARSKADGAEHAASTATGPTAGKEAAAKVADSPAFYTLRPGKSVQFELQTRFIEAVPGDVIELEEGRYELRRQLDLAADKITLRGRGPDKTVLSFKGQSLGAAGIEVTGNQFVLENLAIEDTAGNGLKVLGAKNVTLRDVRVEWTGPQTSANGAYGLYPVQCENVLIERCTAIGASDAGIYVGQCRDVIVRHCRAVNNVAGIEIENTINADVSENVAMGNSGGLLVFDLPGLQQKQGRNVRVFRNQVSENNHVNFADPGGAVASVSPGTGIMVMGTEHVEVFENEIRRNDTVSVLVVSLKMTGRKISDPDFRPTSNFVSIHHNRISEGGTRPSGLLDERLGQVLPKPFPDILWDGVRPEGDVRHALHIAENGEARFVNFNLSDLSLANLISGKYQIETTTTAYAAALEVLPEVRFSPVEEIRLGGSRATEVYRTLPKHLSELKLFQVPLAGHLPQSGIRAYELNTPLFSDGASKRRFFRLPDGEHVTYRADGVFDFPVGTMMSKTFSFPADLREPSRGERHLETRIQIRESDGWYGVAYLWNDDQQDAVLTTGGAEVDVSWIDEEGERQTLRYEVPNANQCLNCHAQKNAYQPLGPTAGNLNRPLFSGSPTGNQLTDLAHLGLLAGLPELQEVGRMPVFDDPATGDLSTRARAWLEVNCAHCHNPGGTARTTGLDLRAAQNRPERLGIFKTPVAAGQGAGGRQYDIVPGHPDDSILVYRLESTEPAIRMPSVGRHRVQPEAVELIREWIETMPASASRGAERAGSTP